jgi:hypothetical protein
MAVPVLVHLMAGTAKVARRITIYSQQRRKTVLTLGELNTQQRAYVRALYAVEGPGSPQQISKHLRIAPEHIVAFFHDLPPGWATVTHGGDLTLTSAGRLAVEQALWRVQQNGVWVEPKAKEANLARQVQDLPPTLVCRAFHSACPRGRVHDRAARRRYRVSRIAMTGHTDATANV